MLHTTGDTQLSISSLDPSFLRSPLAVKRRLRIELSQAKGITTRKWAGDSPLSGPDLIIVRTRTHVVDCAVVILPLPFRDGGSSVASARVERFLATACKYIGALESICSL